jgi:hypothetical protein
MNTTELFVFTADSLENIEIGVRNHTWAVPTSSDTTAADRFIRSQAMPVYSKAIFFCHIQSIFTVPFRIRSIPQDRFQSGIWNETFRFPFAIYPLGDTSKTMDRTTAKSRWPFFDQLRISESPEDFFPSLIAHTDWKDILADLSTLPDGFPEPQEAEQGAAANP